MQHSADVRLFRTDLQGDITIFVKDGKLYGTVDKNLDAKVWIPADADVNEGNAKAEMTEETEEDVLNLLNGTDFTGEAAAAAGIRGVDTSSALFWPERDYVLNKNTKKFHYPECKSVAQMSAKNRQDVTATRQKLIEQGYEPCKNCNP